MNVEELHADFKREKLELLREAEDSKQRIATASQRNKELQDELEKVKPSMAFEKQRAIDEMNKRYEDGCDVS